MIRRFIDWALTVAGAPLDPGSRAIDKMVEAVKSAGRPCIPPPPPASNPRQEFRIGCRPWNQRRPGAAQKELREQLEYLIDVHGEDALCRRLAEAAAKRAIEQKH